MLNKYHFNRVVGRGSLRTGAVALAILTVLLPSCATPDKESHAMAPKARNDVPAEEVADNTDKLIGQTVSARSEVVKILGTNAFKISNEKLFKNKEILVVNASGKPLPVLPDEDMDIQVMGEVRKFRIADVKREFSLDLQPEVYKQFEDRPALVAQSIALAPKVGEVSKNPSFYYNKLIAVEAEVAELVNPSAFTLDEDRSVGDKDLLVLNLTPQATFKKGEDVVVTGVLRPFVVADIDREYDLTWDLNLRRKLEVEYKGKPVLIAQYVFPAVED